MHHDIKPDNIMIRKEMRKNGQGEEEEFIAVKIVDYGTVTDFDYMNSLPAMSRPRVVTTLHYAAPEYDLENDFSGHPWSFDTHSLGASIMQLIYAQMPKLKIEVRDSDILDSYWEPKVPDLKSYILDTALVRYCMRSVTCMRLYF